MRKAVMVAAEPTAAFSFFCNVSEKTICSPGLIFVSFTSAMNILSADQV
jgi:hypothetical protein